MSGTTENTINNVIDMAWWMLDQLRTKEVQSEDRDYSQCEFCGEEIDPVELVCLKCARVPRSILMPNSFKQIQFGDISAAEVHGTYVVKNNSYKKESHYREVVAQRQGEGGTVEQGAVDLVREAFEASPELEMNQENAVKILHRMCDPGDKLYNDKFWWPKYFEQAPQIISRLTKKSPIWVKQNQQEILERMFRNAKNAWEYCPKEIKQNRTSFPNYKVSSVL
jgi:hypothetical protein